MPALSLTHLHFSFAASVLLSSYPARSVFKLKEIDFKYKIFRPGQMSKTAHVRSCDLSIAFIFYSYFSFLFLFLILVLFLFSSLFLLFPCCQVSVCVISAAVRAHGPCSQRKELDIVRHTTTEIDTAGTRKSEINSHRLVVCSFFFLSFVAAGYVLGLDTNPLPVTVPLPPHVSILIQDVFAWEMDPKLHQSFDVLLSDMAPSTTGIKLLDANASHELCQQAVDIAHKILKPNGTLVMVRQQ